MNASAGKRVIQEEGNELLIVFFSQLYCTIV